MNFFFKSALVALPNIIYIYMIYLVSSFYYIIYDKLSVYHISYKYIKKHTYINDLETYIRGISPIFNICNCKVIDIETYFCQDKIVLTQNYLEN